MTHPFPKVISGALASALALLASLPAFSSSSLRDIGAADAAHAAFAPTAVRSLDRRPPVQRSHRLRAGSIDLRYESIVSEWPVRSTAGETIGVVVTQAYVATGGAHDRPVTFVYNGGPGASSWPLHMEGFGPRAYNARRDRLEDNPDSLLDTTDLVFIDPLGTGASFPLTGRDASSVWNTPGDARVVTDVIAGWLKENGRTASPQFLLGESYGTMRSAAILHNDAQAKRLHIRGVMLLSLYLSSDDNSDIQAIDLLPTLAATAYHHHLRTLPATSAETAFTDAQAFARSTYASALLEGSALSQARLEQVASAAAAQTGIPAPTWISHRLRLSTDIVSHGFAVGANTRTGVLDTRQLGSTDLDRLQAPYNDPSMSLGKRSPQLMARYVATLGYTLAAPYRYLNLAINKGDWYFTAPSVGDQADRIDTVPWLEDAMRADPHFQLFTAGGIFDATTPVASGTYLLDHADIDRTRWTARRYASGHGIAEDASQRTVLAQDLRAFIRSSTRIP